ncbi:MAG TPA: PRC-barrel domain-containing protein [Thermomicrobiales bacterium]|nr:PRC-barrel domain-containing protein [Thermomicrobiales bacterium]
MVATHEIRAGARVSGSHGERLGVVSAIRTDEISGEPSALVVKTGIWPLTRHKILSVDTIRQINNDPDTIVVNVSKREFRGIPQIKN